MLERLIKKAETLILFFPTNAYITDRNEEKLMCVTGIYPPAFLSHIIEESLCISSNRWFPLLNDPSSVNQIILSIDAFRFNYLTCPILVHGKAELLITLGPFITERLSGAELRYITQKMKLGGDAATMLETFMSVVPYYTHDNLPKLACFLQDCVQSNTEEPEIITEDHGVFQKDECNSMEEKFVDVDFVEENYAAEEKVLSAIEHGDMEFIRRVLPRNISSFNIPPRYPNDPLRELKNLSITLNSISLRAAVKGGLSHSLAHNMSHTFAILIEKQNDAKSLLELDNKILIEYTQAVRDYGLTQHSELITKAIQIVRRNLASPLSLSHLAKEVAVSPEHLCRQFIREMGITITDFIHKTKIQESCALLVSRKYTINDIALTFGYSSPSHYTEMFSRFMGLPPKRWQLKKQTE